MVRQIAQFSLLLSTIALLGCGGEDLSRFKDGLVPVTGKVTLDGEPVAGVGVLFVPGSATSFGGKIEVGTRVASGMTDAEGKYTLSSPPQGNGVVPGDYAGCLPGDYSVNIMSRESGRGRDGVDTGSNEPQSLGPVKPIPPKYTDPKTSGLKASVSGSGGEFNFELRSK